MSLQQEYKIGDIYEIRCGCIVLIIKKIQEYFMGEVIMAGCPDAKIGEIISIFTGDGIKIEDIEECKAKLL